MSGNLATKQDKRLTKRNPETAARFRRESWWQITFPMLILTLALLGGVAGLALGRGQAGVSVVANYSLILFILPLLLGGLIVIAIIVGLIYLVGLAIHWLPPYTYVAHQAAFDIRGRVVGIANWITGVIISVRAMFDGFWSFLQRRGLAPETRAEAAPAETRRKA
jgi:hypothetical protein